MTCECCEKPESQTYTYPDQTQADYCDSCAQDAGFCPECLQFGGGNEAFEEALHSFGLCDACIEAIEAEMHDFDDDWPF